MGIEVGDLERVEREIVTFRDIDKRHFFVGESDELPGLTFYACVAHIVRSDGGSDADPERVITKSLAELKDVSSVTHHVGVIDRSLMPLDLLVRGTTAPGAIAFEYTDKPEYEEPDRYFQKISFGSQGGAAKRRCFEAQVGISLLGKSSSQETIKGAFSPKEYLGSPVSKVEFDLTLDK